MRGCQTDSAAFFPATVTTRQYPRAWCQLPGL